MHESEAGWNVRELAELAGTTVRTIHYYISEGLLPPAAGATRNASYAPAHLARLRLIGALRDEGLALASIRQRLAPLADEQALEVVGELDGHLSQARATPLTTLGLIEAALASRNVAERGAAPHLSQPSASPDRPNLMFERNSAELDSPGTAGDYLNRVLRKSTSRPGQPVQLPPSKPLTPPLHKPAVNVRPEAWYHFQIEDGIELRVREDRYREAKGRLSAVIDTLRSALRRYGVAQPDNDER